MADKKLQIVLELVDKASTQMKKVGRSFDDIAEKAKEAGKKITIMGGAITAGLGFAVNEAAKAEGAMAKFNTVFAEGSEEMQAFIDDLRKEMPTARHEIVACLEDCKIFLSHLACLVIARRT